MSRDILIKGGKVVKPDATVLGDVLVRDGKIEYIGSPVSAGGDCQLIDVDGSYVMPGFIDMHSDAIEQELEPRPGVFFPFGVAFRELERKLAAHGITTMYHSFSLAGAEWGMREDNTAAETIRAMMGLARRSSLINHKLHLRFEVTNCDGVAVARQLIEQGYTDLLSFTDHSPGQGQYPTVADYTEYMTKYYNMTQEEIQELLAMKCVSADSVNLGMTVLSAAAAENGVPLASHDDDTAEKIDCYRQYGLAISEFPVNMTAAGYAKRLGLTVCMGAPNVVRGGSSGKGMRALDAIKAGYVDALCSDYYPASLLHAVFSLADSEMAITDAVKYVAQSPAAALGLAETGRLEEGKTADIIIVRLIGGIPVVTHTVVDGQLVYGAWHRSHSEER